MLALGGYFYYFIFAWDDFFYTKEQNGIFIVGIAMFLVTFACGFITMSIGNKKGISSQMPLDELKNLPKTTIIILGVVCGAEIIVLLIGLHQLSIIWLIGVLMISFSFVIMEMVVISKIATSTMYKISLPWYVPPIPFVLFIGGELYFGYHLSEEVFDKVGIIIFVLCGALMACIAWHENYIIDDDKRTLERNKGLLADFIKKKDFITFDDICYYEKKGMYYIVVSDEKVYKISRLYSSSKELERILEGNGVRQRSHNL